MGPVLLLSQLLLSELPASSKARYPPIPPSASLKISSVFVQLGVVEHLRQRLMDATEALTKEPSRQPDSPSHPGEQLSAPHSVLHPQVDQLVDCLEELPSVKDVGQGCYSGLGPLVSLVDLNLCADV